MHNRNLNYGDYKTSKSDTVHPKQQGSYHKKVIYFQALLFVLQHTSVSIRFYCRTKGKTSKQSFPLLFQKHNRSLGCPVARFQFS